MLVNKHRSLEKDFEPDDLVSIDEEYAADDTQAGSRICLLYTSLLRLVKLWLYFVWLILWMI